MQKLNTDIISNLNESYKEAAIQFKKLSTRERAPLNITDRRTLSFPSPPTANPVRPDENSRAVSVSQSANLA